MKFSAIFLVVFVCALLYVECEGASGNSGGSGENNSRNVGSGENSQNPGPGSGGEDEGETASALSLDASVFEDLTVQVEIKFINIPHLILLILETLFNLIGQALTETLAVKIYSNVGVCVNLTVETNGPIELRVCTEALLDFVLGDLLQGAITVALLITQVVASIAGPALGLLQVLLPQIDILTSISVIGQVDVCLDLKIIETEFSIEACLTGVQDVLVTVLQMVLPVNLPDLSNVHVVIKIIGLEEALKIPALQNVFNVLLSGLSAQLLSGLGLKSLLDDIGLMKLLESPGQLINNVGLIGGAGGGLLTSLIGIGR